MKNILFDLQLSVLTSLKDGNFIFETDSNVNVARFTIKGLLKKSKNLHFYLLVPEKTKIEAIKRKKIKTVKSFMKDIANNKRVTFIEYPYYGNPFIDRMSFNSRNLKKELKDIKIDLVYTNDPNKVLAYKTFFYQQQNEFVPVISRNHWVTGKLHRKVPKKIDFIIRQIEGTLNSDFSTFNSKTAIKMLIENSKEHFNDNVRKAIRKKSVPIDTVDLEKVDSFKNDFKFDKFTILWGHRLSYYTGWEEVFNVLNKIYEKRKDFILVAPDPGNKFSQKELKKKYPFLSQINKKKWSHEDYLKMCWTADLVIGNHNIPTTWGGLALTEPMTAETAVLMPKKDGYLEMHYKDKDSKYVFFKNKKELEKLISLYINDKKLLRRMKKKARKFCKEELSMKKYISTLYNLIKICT